MKYELQVNPLIGFRWENDSKGKQSEWRKFTDFMMMLLLNAYDLFTLEDASRDEIWGFQITQFSLVLIRIWH